MNLYKLSSLLLLVSNLSFSQQINLSDASWFFRQADTEKWLSARVPGNVHLDLLENKKIEAPYYRLNESHQKWIENEDWEYKTFFNIDPEVLLRDVIEINFEGLDTYGDVYLNDNLIIEANNFFRSWSANVKEFLKQGKNELRVYFHSPITYVLAKYKSLPYKFPSPNDQSDIQVSMFTRKPGYQYGWDWGPRFVSCGIWKNVILSAWDHSKVTNIWIKQEELLKDEANLNIILEVTSLETVEAKVSIIVEGVEISETTTLQKGLNTCSVPFKIENPELWWPNGMGNQKLYQVDVSVKTNTQTQKFSEKIGLRNIEVVAEKDAMGRSFFFKVNGIPFFAKGSNYIPQDLFLNRVTDEKYQHLIKSCADANMNMIRVWGGGFYENDIFYNLCDELGLVVWQDFMFACTLYPSDKEFVDNVKQEAIENIKRLRNHPSIGVWCGNNEIETAIHNWGGFKKLEKKYPIIRKNYNFMFEEMLPALVKKYDPEKFYIPSSPTSFGKGINPNEKSMGDLHYWSVWSGGRDFKEYKNNVGRFMSEYGFQSFPSLNTMQKVLDSADLEKYSDAMIYRTRWGNSKQYKTGWKKGIDHLENYIQTSYPPSTSYSDFIYKSQYLQADAIRFAVLQHRKKSPFCMGTLYWQLNDVWPGASWSGIDYYGNWKPLHYQLKRAFKKVAVFVEPKQKRLEIFVASDELNNIQSRVELSIFSLNGKLINSIKKNILIHKQATTQIINAKYKNILKGSSREDVIVKIALINQENVITEETLLLNRIKNVNLLNAHISTRIIRKAGKPYLELKTDNHAIGVWVEYENGSKLLLEDNFVNIIAGEVKLLPLSNISVNHNIEDFKINWINN
ncbi:glycoside hydrolase family 2 protein [uncultured Polaribacter sp.]|uniref:beta-mannosidase n=1 Tax=uncultured Polaribacter sp. TaxID=174711 RepID=UPI00261AFE22|nr:glycoside hydrolase family 2 protein [uncultured Polaribacter sp.]